MNGQPVWYAVIDGAQDERLAPLVQGCRNHACLFKGKLGPKLASAAPWLVQIVEGENLMPIWQQHGRGANWGIMLLSDRGIEAVHRHLRRFLQARLPDGTVALFRFYDPRVFNTYIRAALPDERAPWFGVVSQYAAEAAGGHGLHQYRLEEGRLFDGNQPIG